MEKNNEHAKFFAHAANVTRLSQDCDRKAENGLVVKICDASVNALAYMLKAVGDNKFITVCGTPIIYMHVYPDHITLDTESVVDSCVSIDDERPNDWKDGIYDNSPDGIAKAVYNVKDAYSRVQ